MRPNYGPVVVPPTGVFTIKDHAGYVIEGMTRDELVTKLTNSRIANKLPIGDPGRDVDSQLIGQVGYSTPMPVSLTEPLPRTAPKLIDRVNSWVQNRIRNKAVQFVKPNEALRRAAICAQCPSNRDWKGSCAACSSESKRVIDRDVIILSQNKQTPISNRLKACAVTGQENRAAVWLEEKFLLHRRNYMEKLPGFCWLTTLGN